MPANYSLNFDFGTCSVSPLGRGKKPSRLQQMLGDDPFENSLVEQMSLINKAIFQAPAPSYSKRCVTARCFPKHFDSIFFRLSIAMCDFSRASEAATRALSAVRSRVSPSPPRLTPTSPRVLSLSPVQTDRHARSTHPWSPADCVWLDSMAGYHFPAVFVRCKRGPATRTVVHCHANACDMGHIYELCQRDAECWRANVLLVEYPGYGASPGVSYERSVDRHVMVAYNYLVEDLRLAPESVVLFGRSLGSGPVCRLALRLQELGEKVGGVILHSPFVSVREVGLSLLGPVAHVMSDRWDNEKPLAALRCRLLIIHGASDEVVPFTHAERLRDVRVANKLHVTFFPTQGTHNYFSYYRDYLHPVENFLEGHKARALPPLPDPLPRAKYSKAQVKEIMELRRKKGEERTASEEYGTNGSTAQRTRSRRDATRDGVRSLLSRGDDVRRDGSPNSTLVDGGANASGPTSSDDDEDIGGKNVTKTKTPEQTVKDVSALDARLMSLSSPEVNARNAGRTPGPRRERWSKAKGRVSDALKETEKRQSFDRSSGGYLDDDFVAERVPGGASPFGVKKTAARR
jgi:pimeloyl-ACP methyl ester carboxylesterase